MDESCGQAAWVRLPTCSPKPSAWRGRRKPEKGFGGRRERERRIRFCRGRRHARLHARSKRGWLRD
eukprot:12858246-Alexandrium_andersonii.AAC.1